MGEGRLSLTVREGESVWIGALLLQVERAAPREATFRVSGATLEPRRLSVEAGRTFMLREPKLKKTVKVTCVGADGGRVRLQIVADRAIEIDREPDRKKN